MKKKHILAIVLGGVFLFCLFAGCIVYFIFALLGNATPATLAIHLAEQNPAVTASIGVPLQKGFWVTGNIATQNSTGTADLAIPVSGPHGKGKLYIQAEESMDTWRAIRLEFQLDGPSARVLIVEP